MHFKFTPRVEGPAPQKTAPQIGEYHQGEQVLANMLLNHSSQKMPFLAMQQLYLHRLYHGQLK
jgi:hypothetical protein